jgi:hypothetical protein
MDALLVLGLLIAVALAAPRWGADSRPAICSKDRALAGWGVTWETGRSA